MSISEDIRRQIAERLTTKIREKLNNYTPETVGMPFHVRLLGKDRLALYSFVQSVNTMLGQSIFEYIAELIGRSYFAEAKSQYKQLPSLMSRAAQQEIEKIIQQLKAGNATPRKQDEINRIIRVAGKKPWVTIRRPTVDLFLLGHDGTEYYVELKTAKPNIDQIIELKRKLLQWVANRALDTNAGRPKAIETFAALPYNPYEPEQYQRWTFQGMLDVEHELKVAEEFWDFLGGKGTYDDLLQVFENVGIELRDEIDHRFRQLATDKNNQRRC